MKKFLVFLLVIFIALPIAGIYGAIHDQISYTVSEEYFTRFKFIQFGLVDTPIPARMKVSIIGFLASWWMGVPIGLLIGAVAFVHRDWRNMLRVSLQSVILSVIVTLVVGLIGLSYGWMQTTHFNLADYQGWFIPENLVEPRRFLCAGYMHNASYLGGVLAIPAAWVFNIMRRVKPEPIQKSRT